MEEGEILRLYNAILEIMDRVGMTIENDKILQRLDSSGWRVDWGHRRVTFPSHLVQSFLDDTEKVDMPNSITIDARVEIYEGTYLDAAYDKHVPWSENHILEVAKLVERLPHISGGGMLGCPIRGTPLLLQPLYERLVCWRYGLTSHGSIWETWLCPHILEMCEVMAESTESEVGDWFRASVYLVSPLKLGRVEAEQFLYFAERGLPVQIGNMGSLGGTNPVTIAGSLALFFAEKLMISIIMREYYGDRRLALNTGISVLDMRTGAFQYGRPEVVLINAAGAELARYLGLPFHGQCGLSDAKIPSAEAGYQKALTAWSTALATGHGYVAAGLLGVDEIVSPVQIVLDNDFVGALKRITRGFEVSEETLAVDVIEAVGPASTFLDTEHTFKHFREEIWEPTTWSQQMYAVWRSKGRENDEERARKLIEAVVTEPFELRLDEEQEHKLMDVIARAQKSL